jgi:hypothetical protein
MHAYLNIKGSVFFAKVQDFFESELVLKTFFDFLFRVDH